MKPRAMRVTLPKEARRAPGTRGERPAWRDKPAGKRGDEAQRAARGAAREGAPGRGGKPFGQREERGSRTEWKPRERTFGGSASGAGRSGDRPRFDKRAGGPPRTGSGVGARPSRPFGAKPGFGGGREGSAGQSGERGGERKEWKPREQAAGGIENAPRKPFRAQGDRPAFVRPEGSFKPGDGPKKRFEGGRGAGSGTGKSFGRRTGSKERWVPRPDRARAEEGRGQTSSGERPAPAFGARPGGFKRPGKPGGFAKPGGFSRPGRPSGGANRGGTRFERKRPEGR